MYQLLETIKIVNGTFQNIEFHNNRFIKSYIELYKKSPDFLLIEKVRSINGFSSKGIVKCRFLYNKTDYKFEFTHYKKQKILSLKVIYNNKIDYSLKYVDRSYLNLLLNQKGNCDDILIIKNGFVTDTSFSNILFFDGKNYFTPSTPLLQGTYRAKLLSENKILEKAIKINDIKNYISFKLINAMRDIETEKDISVTKIKL